MDLFILLFCIAGITISLNHAKIFNLIGLRQFWEKSDFFKSLLECSLCTSFWISIGYGIPCWIINQFSHNLFIILTIPFAGVSFTFLMERVIVLVDDNINKLNE